MSLHSSNSCAEAGKQNYPAYTLRAANTFGQLHCGRPMRIRGKSVASDWYIRFRVIAVPIGALLAAKA